MLEDCLVESRSSARRRSPLTLALSVLTHGGIVAAMVIIPLFQSQVLPQILVVPPLRPPEALRRSIELVPVQSSGGAPAPTAPPELIAPIAIPSTIIRFVDEPVNSGGFVPSTGAGSPFGSPNGGVPFGIPSSVATPPPPPPPSPPPVVTRPPEPEPPPQAPSGPIRKGGDVVMSNLVHQVNPVYPPLARAVRVQAEVPVKP